MHIFTYSFLVLSFVLFGIFAGGFIRTAKILGSIPILFISSFFIFGSFFLTINYLSDLFSEVPINHYKLLAILSALTAFITEAVIGKIFLEPHDQNDNEI